MASRAAVHQQRQQTIGEAGEFTAARKRSRKESAGVSFQPKLSVYSITGMESEYDLELTDHDEDQHQYITNNPDSAAAVESNVTWWEFLANNIYFQQFFRAISVVNLIVLILSIPFYELSTLTDTQLNVISIQFKVITVFDFILSCIYTFHMSIRIASYVKLARANEANANDEFEDSKSYASFRRTFSVFLLTLSMWYSVGIGIYRSVSPTISQWLYVGFIPRAILAVFPAIKLMLIRMESSAVKKLFQLLRWKQLAMVTGFYFINVFIFALMGVHIIGELDHICMYRTMDENGNFSVVPAIPLIHCNPSSESRDLYCALDTTNNTGLVCLQYPPHDDKTLFFKYRSYVYYGQYRSIVDALFAVYEASTLELWNFMMYAAVNGRSIVPFLFYFFLILYVVIILQQSIFLVVIIESFADLRDQSAFLWSKTSSSEKGKTKPKFVLTLEDPATTRLKLDSLDNDSSAEFINKYSKLLVKFEKFFLVLVIIDAILVATKYAEMESDHDWHRLVLQAWQPAVSAVFVMEVFILFFFHLYHGQWKLFFRRPYYICLTILAIGGLVASLPVPINGFYFYDPYQPASAFAIFQSLRFPRLLRLSQSLLDFTLKITGKSILILSVITLVLICWLSVFNAQLFGYTIDYPKGCEDISSGHFGSFLEAFMSTFQIVMNEGWTNVTSEVFCLSKYWFVTNLYFIFIHLFSSLIFLNFFGAVILDNLEYDEEEKKAKLEEIKKKEAKSDDTIPYRLRIFNQILGNEPKRLKPPPGITEDPKISEAEIRRFFDSASPSNIAEDTLDYSSQYTSPVNPVRSQTSLIRHLSLVSSENSDLISSEAETPMYQGIYNSISSILHYISVWRKYNEEEQSRDPHSSNIHYLYDRQSAYNRMNLHSNNIRSEYEIYKEKHRFFDMALFCMPPEHKLRRFCTKLLTAQAEEHHYVLKKGKVFQMLKIKTLSVLRWIISRLPYFTWFVFLGLLCVVLTQVSELAYESYHPVHTFTPLMEGFYLVLMFSWLIIRIISRGCFLNPHAAINSIWDVLDWILVLDSALFFVLLPLWFEGKLNPWSLELDIVHLPICYKILFIIRCLRPLHIISVLIALRAVVKEIVEGWRNLLKAVILLVGFMFMFASLGVQIFAGTTVNPLAYCNDPSIHEMENCTGNFKIKVDTSREFLPLNNSRPSQALTFEMLVPRVWYPYARDFPFNNVPLAFVTLFELLTLEGWIEVRDLFKEKTTINFYMNVYIHVFVFFAVNIGLQLFLGIVVNNFNEHKPGHTFLLSVDQNRWTELMQRISLQRPDKIPLEPRNNKLRLKIYRLLTHQSYRIVPTIIAGLSALTLVVPWNIKYLGEEAVQTLIILAIFFNMYTVLEMLLKLLAFGSSYFISWRNLFDCFLIFPSIGFAAFGIIAISNPSSGLYRMVSYIALVIVVMKIVTVMIKYSALLNLLLTVLNTLRRSVSLLMVLIIISFCFAMLGVALFSNLRTGEAIAETYLNFKGSDTALGIVWRSFTGEDWYQFMWDAAVSYYAIHSLYTICIGVGR